MFSIIEGEDKPDLRDVDFSHDTTSIEGEEVEGEEPGYTSDYDVYVEGEEDSEGEDKYANYGYEEEEDNSNDREDEDYEDGMESKTFKKPILSQSAIDRSVKIKADYDKASRKSFEKQKNINKISLFLESNGFISKNNKLLAEYIFDSVNIIKNYRMSYKVKMNRINFFATTL